MIRVAELIARLQALPPDAVVLLADWNEGYAPDALDWGLRFAPDYQLLGPNGHYGGKTVDGARQFPAVILGDA
jgi:hypothetical protein